MYQWIRPEIIVPVHGEMRHMSEHERFARANGVPRGIVQKNGDVVRLAPDGPKKIGEETGRAADPRRRRHPRRRRPDDERAAQDRRPRASIAVALALNAQDRLRRRRRDRARGHSGRGGSRGLPRRGLRGRVGGRAQGRGERGQAARGDPPRRAPLRHRMDRQEAGGGRPHRPGVTAVKLQSILAIYILFWTMSLFVVLPFGVRTPEEEGSRRPPGHAPSAPHRFSFGRAALRATIVSAVRSACSTPITCSAG